MAKKTPTQLDREINQVLLSAPSQKTVEKTDEELKKSGLCAYCKKPTRKGSALIDGWPAHKSCVAEYED